MSIQNSMFWFWGMSWLYHTWQKPKLLFWCNQDWLLPNAGSDLVVDNSFDVYYTVKAGC